MLCAERQVMQGRRTTTPVFLAPALLSNGEMSHDLLDLCTTIVSEYRYKTRLEYPEKDQWGQSVNTRVAAFKSDLFYEIMAAMVTGDARMQLRAGTEWNRSKSVIPAVIPPSSPANPSPNLNPNSNSNSNSNPNSNANPATQPQPQPQSQPQP